MKTKMSHKSRGVFVFKVCVADLIFKMCFHSIANAGRAVRAVNGDFKGNAPFADDLLCEYIVQPGNRHADLVAKFCDALLVRVVDADCQICHNFHEKYKTSHSIPQKIPTPK